MSLDRRRLDTRRDDLSREDANRRLFRARELDVERALPPLTPSDPIGGLITPEELEIQRQLAEPDRPPPVGLPPLEDRLAPATPFESSGVAAIDDFEPAPAAGQNEELTFALQERERALRANERRSTNAAPRRSIPRCARKSTCNWPRTASTRPTSIRNGRAAPWSTFSANRPRPSVPPASAGPVRQRRPRQSRSRW